MTPGRNFVKGNVLLHGSHIPSDSGPENIRVGYLVVMLRRENGLVFLSVEHCMYQAYILLDTLWTDVLIL